MQLVEKKSLLALSYVPKIGIKNLKKLLDHFGSATIVWNLSPKEKNSIKGLPQKAKERIGDTEIWELMEQEIAFCYEHKIQIISKFEDGYPPLLKECSDAPFFVFMRGNIDLHEGKFVSVVGTRKMTARGKEFIHELIDGFQNQPITIVSGLALGVDSEAHISAIQNKLQTIGVLAHGVNQIFPKSNEKIGIKMMKNGGLLSEFSTFHKPEPENFLRRNRIIAGLCHATIVIESALKGGAMSTATHANNYNRDVFALPGRTTDFTAEGCHYLIKNHKAFLITEANDVLKYLNITPKPKKNIQTELFVELKDNEKILYEFLKNNGRSHIDSLSLKLNLTTYQIMPTLLSLELKGLVEPLPGKFYNLM